jgi:16S rRNA (guanine527-N7)-methyltransferase
VTVDGISVIARYFPELAEYQLEKLRTFGNLLMDWNKKINLVSRKDVGELSVRHLLHSLSIAKIIEFKSGTRILDIGTGGGFPGIPLAIFFPEANFSLVDSIGKKIMVVNEILKKLDLKNVMAKQIRAEQVTEKFDFIVSRAVTTLPELYSMVKDKIKHDHRNTLPNGIICLKGGELTPELKELKKTAEIFPIGRYFSEEFFETKKIVFIPCG